MRERGECRYGEVCREICHLRSSLKFQSEWGGGEDESRTVGGGPFWQRDNFINFTKRVMIYAIEKNCCEAEIIQDEIKEIIHQKNQKGKLTE